MPHTCKDTTTRNVRIIQDTDPMNVREEYDNVGTMVCWHNRYDLGDKHDHSSPGALFASLLEHVTDLKVLRDAVASVIRADPDARDNFRYLAEGWSITTDADRVALYREYLQEYAEDTQEVADAVETAVIILPLYLYDHGGITMSTGRFSCPWDSGQVGYIYALRGFEGMTDEQITRNLEGEVETYDQYLTGDVYGFEVYDTVVCESCGHESEEHVDSCWGFYGSDPFENGMSDYVDEELHDKLRDAADNIQYPQY